MKVAKHALRPLVVGGVSLALPFLAAPSLFLSGPAYGADYTLIAGNGGTGAGSSGGAATLNSSPVAAGGGAGSLPNIPGGNGVNYTGDGGAGGTAPAYGGQGGGGGGGTSGSAGNGGGGSYAGTLSGPQTYGTLTLQAGTGGGVGDGGGGGGGAAALSITGGSLNATTGLQISAGNGGAGTSAFGGKGGGGGGKASLSVTGGNLTTTSLTMTGGTDGGSTAFDGKGGAATLSVSGSLTASTITLTKNAGGLSLSAGTLDSSASNTTLTLTGTAASDVTFNTIALGGGKTLSVTGGGAFSFNTLSVGGKNTTYNGSLSLNAAGKTLTFALPSGMSNGDTMLAVTGGGAVALNNSTVLTLNGMSEAVASLIPGHAITLIGATSGAIAGNSQSYTNGTTTRTVFVNSNNNRLSAFVTKLETDTLHTAENYSVTAGNGAGENVALNVSGALSVDTGKTLSLTSGTGVNGGTASLNVGTLNAPQLSLVKKDAALNAVIGTLDMRAAGSALSLDGTATNDVRIGTLLLGGGKTFAVTSLNSGAFTFDTLSVQGKNAVYNSAAPLNAAGKTLNFTLPSTTGNGDVMLAITGGGTVALANDTAISLNTVAASLPILAPGNAVTLIDHVTGSITAAPQTLNDSVTTQTFSFNTNNGKLSAFLSVLEIPSFSTVSSYSVTAGTNSNEGVTLSIPSLLRVDGTLTLTSGTGINSGSATLNAGTLMTPHADFVKKDGDLHASIGTLNMQNVDTELKLDGTAANDVRIGTLLLGDGKTFAVTSLNGGLFSFDTLSVQGRNAVYSGAGPLDAAGKNLFFALPAALAPGDVMLRAAAGGVNINNAHVTLTAGSGLTHLSAGDIITLIDTTTGTIASNNTTQSVNYGGGTYTFAISSDGNALHASLGNDEKKETDPSEEKKKNGGIDYTRSKAYGEGQMAGFAALGSGSDLIAGNGMGQAMGSVGARGAASFAATSGSSLRYKTGSHVDANGIGLISGAAFRGDTVAGSLLAGVFIEGGWGTYSTFNSFPSGAVKGSGTTHYLGGGVMIRHDFKSGLYAEGSMRSGKVKTDFSSGAMNNAAYDSSVWYYGGHGGVGWIANVSADGSLDTYAKLLWTRQQGDSVSPVAGEHIRFDSTDSLRSWLGTRYSHTLGDSGIKGYIGAGWEYEFKGDMTLTNNGNAVSSPSLGGSTGIGEIGITWQPAAAWKVDLGLQGMLGQREGVAGMLSATYTF